MLCFTEGLFVLHMKDLIICQSNVGTCIKCPEMHRSQVYQPHPLGKGVSAFSLKIFDGKCVNVQICTQNFIFLSPSPHWVRWGQFTKNIFCLGITIKCSEIYRKVMFACPSSPMGWDQLTKFFFAHNSVIYPDLHGKVIFSNSATLMGMYMEVKGSIYNFILWWIEWNVQILTGKSCFPMHHPCLEWGIGINFPLKMFCYKLNKMSISAQKNNVFKPTPSL